jgi:acyl-CoA hydrolase
MPKMLAANDVPALLRPGMTVYAPGMAGESRLVVEALKAAPEAAAGVRFVGVWLPGYNRIDYAGLDPAARATAFFVTPDMRPSFEAGRIDHVPISYFAAYGHLQNDVAVDLALLQVSPPDDDGRVGLGLAHDFTPAILAKARVKVAHVNPDMPRTRGTSTLHVDDLDVVIEAAVPVAGDDAAADPAFAAIGRHVATLVRDGDTLEVGIGRVQGVLDALAGHRDLAFHTGAITDPVRRLAEAGAIANREDAITTGVAWGGAPLQAFCGGDPRVRFVPVGWTHDIATLRRIDRFVAVNAVIEVDLLGQANAEMVDGRQISGAGGITDFMRGARLSAGGLAIVVLPAAAKGGTVSRIVPALGPGTAISVARNDMDVVVTEHGIADLRHRSVDGRAEALIAVAAPPFRDSLAAAWRERRRRL